MKLFVQSAGIGAVVVTLRVRVWIEITPLEEKANPGGVTLRVRVWIEIILPDPCGMP